MRQKILKEGRKRNMVKLLISIFMVAAFMFPTATIFAYAEKSSENENINAIVEGLDTSNHHFAQSIVRRFGDYGVELSCDDPYQVVNGGETIEFVVKIKNTGTLDDTYEITAGSIEDIVCKVNGVNADPITPYIISLMAGASTTFDVTAEVGESVQEGEWFIVVSAYSQNDTDVYDELYLTVAVKDAVGTGLSSVKIIQPEKESYILNGKKIRRVFPFTIEKFKAVLSKVAADIYLSYFLNG